MLALWGGLWIRGAAWRVTLPIHFTGDLANAYAWGTRSLESGYLRLYDTVAPQKEGGYRLDYPPLRLLIVTRWVKWLRETHPTFEPRSWSRNMAPDFDRDAWPRSVVKPLLRLNLAAELATALGIFLLVRAWFNPPGSGGLPRPRSEPDGRVADALLMQVGRGAVWMGLDARTLGGLVAALLFWMNPAVIVDAHVFPQWDVWLLPFFVFGVLSASLDRWFLAGILVAAGSMFKGQLLLVAPLFALWPLFGRRWGAALQWLGGFAAAAAVIVSPWLLGSRTGALWVAVVLIALGLARAWPGGRPGSWSTGTGVLLLLVATLWPWLLDPGRGESWLGLLFAGALVGAARLVPTRQTRYLAAFVLAGALLICGVAFEGSFAWFHVGFENHAERSFHFEGNVGNLGRLLRVVPGWRADTPLLGGSLMGLPTGRLTLGLVLVLAYAAGLVLCSRAAATHARRRDSRFLVAVVAPWVLLFLLLPNVKERYLVWGAGLTAVGSGVGWRMVLIHALVTLAAWENESRVLLGLNPGFAPRLHAALEALHPAGAWLVLACGLALLWVVMKPPARDDLARDCG